jgi:hypothetical protein
MKEIIRKLAEDFGLSPETAEVLVKINEVATSNRPAKEIHKELVTSIYGILRSESEKVGIVTGEIDPMLHLLADTLVRTVTGGE